MLGVRKISADSNGATVAAYYDNEIKPTLDVGAGGTPAPNRASGERVANYYTREQDGAVWSPHIDDKVAAALGINPAKAPDQKTIARLVEARRADTGEKWEAKSPRKVSALDLTFSPHKSWSLASAFAPTEAERQIIHHIETQANEKAMEYAAEILGWARLGKHGQDGAERGDVAWMTVRHKTARPTLHVEDPDTATTYLVDLASVGDPQDHHHNILFNLVVTEDGRVGSLDTKRLRDRVHEIGAVYQAYLAEYGRRFNIAIEYDAKQEAAIISKVDKAAVTEFSKRHRQIEREAKARARQLGLAWDTMDIQKKKGILAKTGLTARIRKLGEDEVRGEEAWRARAAAIGWTQESVIDRLVPVPMWSDKQRYDLAYDFAATQLAKEFRTAAVVDLDLLRTFVARGLIATGMKTPGDIDIVTDLVEARGIRMRGQHVRLHIGESDGKLRITNSEQIRIETTVMDEALTAAQSKAGALSADAIRDAIARSGLDFVSEPEHGQQQLAAIYALGTGSDLTVLTGVAGAGKTTLLTPLVAAYKADGRQVIGIATAWRQADALKDTGIGVIDHEVFGKIDPAGRPTTRESIASMKRAGTDGTYALTRFLRMVDRGELDLNERTVLIVDEVSQIAPRQFLKLLELRARTGMVIKALGDPNQVQAIEAGDTMRLLDYILPVEAKPFIGVTVRQRTRRGRDIAGRFRNADAASALKMKREDGTAQLIGGDLDQVADRIAEFYLQRRDILQARGGNRGITISVPTNDDAAAISHAVRDKLKSRGEITGPDTILKAIDQRGEHYDLPVAQGDRVRLFRKTWTQFHDARHGYLGNNGDILDVVAVSQDTITLRRSDGRTATVRQDALREEKTGRIMLGFGHAMTIDSAQGITSTEHINALPRGTANLTAFKAYVAESRHIDAAWTMIGEGGLLEAERLSRAIGDTTPITASDLWKRAAADMSEQRRKALGVELMDLINKQQEQIIESRSRKSRSTERWMKFQREVETTAAAGEDPAKHFQQKTQEREASVALAEHVQHLARVIRQSGDGWDSMTQAQIVALDRAGAAFARPAAKPTSRPRIG
ncbi:relaxase domain-containing protein [Acidiphilium sp. PA]|uniref:MobF family relaxase n=1 Tax=Acidiphilium sp. PA TaxID=2871705 RepID=UPI002243DAC4|nr:MobF family relaxase [Acidiphilium sp. PA]MCW8309185.1 relaxase domain-containing protein [Acidiphilium sp. PA]